METGGERKEDIREALRACLPDMADYCKIKGKLTVRLLGKEACKKIKDPVYEMFGDVIMLLCIRILDNDGRTVNCMVDNSLFQTWGISKKQVFQEALEAASIFAPPRLYPLEEFPLPDGYEGHAFMSGGYTPVKDIGGNCLSTTSWKGGAAAIFYPGVAERLEEIFGGGFFLLFLNSDQVRIYYEQPEDRRLMADSLHSSICRLSRQVEVLSTKVYYYRKKEGLQIERG